VELEVAFGADGVTLALALDMFMLSAADIVADVVQVQSVVGEIVSSRASPEASENGAALWQK
jgi:hypothetical protein